MSTVGHIQLRGGVVPRLSHREIISNLADRATKAGGGGGGGGDFFFTAANFARALTTLQNIKTMIDLPKGALFFLPGRTTAGIPSHHRTCLAMMLAKPVSITWSRVPMVWIM